MDSRTVKRTAILTATAFVIIGAGIFGLFSMQSAISQGSSPDSIPTLSSDIPISTDDTPDIKW